MPKTLIQNHQPLVETSINISEAEAIMAAANPKGHLSPLVGGYPFVPRGIYKPITDKDTKKWETIDGETYIQGEPRISSFLIKYPGFIAKSIARVRHKEPNAKLHITIN